MRLTTYSVTFPPAPPTTHRLPEIDLALQVISEILQQLTNQKSAIEEDIHSTFDELQKTLNVRKSVLLMELEVTYGLKQKVRGVRACGGEA